MAITRIQWSEQENREVAVRWIDICMKNDEDPLAPKSFGAVAREAQLVLDESRQRPTGKLAGRSATAQVLKQVEIILEERKKSAKAQERAAKKLEHEQLALAKATPVSPKAPEAQPKQETLESTMLRNGSLEELVKSFAQGISTIVVSELTKAIRQTFHAEFPKLLSRTLAVSQVLPRILVCGPLPKQQPMLEEAVAGVADLRFVSSEETPRLVTTRGQNCAAAVLWSDFINHSHQNAAKALFGSERTFIVSGGIETLKGRVEEVALHIPEVIH